MKVTKANMLVFCSTSRSTDKTSDPDRKTGTLGAEVLQHEEAGLRVLSLREPEPRTGERAREGGLGLAASGAGQGGR